MTEEKMFTPEFSAQIEKAFEAQMQRLGEMWIRIEKILETCSVREKEALQCLYASMPVSDALDYPPELYLSYARHGVYLWENGPFAGEIPEEIFAAYVLHHRINNEDLTDSRSFFYEQVKDRIKGKNMREAILDINYWCASCVTYRTTDDRTAGPAAVFASGYGRCGEESVFAASVLRSAGIPARQVYVPLWSHCDDNHAWVEVWCSGEWKFLGACEPEEILNKGWFTDASSRAMMVHSRWFLPAEPQEERVGKRGMALMINHLKRYAHTVRLEVLVRDENGAAAPDAEVRFEVMNYACLGEIASAVTDQNGTCILETGLGTLHVIALKDGKLGEALIDTQQTDRCVIELKAEPDKKEGWKEMIFAAPKDAPINRCIQSEKEREQGREKAKAAKASRQKRVDGFYDTQMAEQAVSGLPQEDRERCLQIMKLACGNQSEIADFLSRPTDGKWPEKWKTALLESLREKDYHDITADILEETCIGAAAAGKKYEDAVFIPYVLCPRVENEMIRPFRSFIASWLSEEQKAAITENPVRAWELVKETIKTKPELEYENLVISAKGALTGGYGSMLTKKTVCVQILRTLGIAARLNPADHTLEIWKDGSFALLEACIETQSERTAGIIVCGEKEKAWTYFQNWTIARLEADGYRTLHLCGESGEVIRGEILLFPGRYRILTANRLPNGNIFAKKLDFELKDGEKREIHLEQMEAQAEDLLEENAIADFALRNENGTLCKLSELVREKKGLFVWLKESEEPTEHILNEIAQRKEAFRQRKANLYFVIDHPQVRENQTVKRAVSGLSGVHFLYEESQADTEVLARRMYLEPGKFPLAVIIDENLTGLYGTAGYNVGSAEIILKILNISK